MRKLTNEDIPIIAIAQKIASKKGRVSSDKKFRETGEILFLQKLGRKPREVDKETERIILEVHK